MITLASSSPRRKKLMESIFGKIEVVHPEVNELAINGESPHEMVKRLAILKARTVKSTNTIVAADTVVEIGGKILGKPRDIEEARKMLRVLSGKWHTVHTGVCIIHGKKEKAFVESTRVKFHVLDEETINMYVQTGSPMDKAGAYGIQEDMGMILVERINGDFFTVVGLPISRVWWEIKNLTIEN